MILCNNILDILKRIVIYIVIYTEKLIKFFRLLKVETIKIYYDCNTTHTVVQLQRSQIRQNNAYHRKFNLFAALLDIWWKRHQNNSLIQMEINAHPPPTVNK